MINNDNNQILNQKMQKTASTLFDLKDHTDIKYVESIADLLIAKIGIKLTRISTDDFSAFPVARFNTTHSFIELLIEKFGDNLQVIELGSGFTPHSLNLSHKISKYVEVELEDNSILKKDIVSTITTTDSTIYISGDILDEITWTEIAKNIDLNKPTIIFSEGVVSQYFTNEQKQLISTFVSKFLTSNGSCFVLDDTLRNHKNLHANPIIKRGMEQIVQKSGSLVYNNKFQTFDEEVNNWKKYLNDKNIYTINYILSKPEMDFAVSQFKLIVIMNDPKNIFSSNIEKLSVYNKSKRIWKN